MSTSGSPRNPPIVGPPIRLAVCVSGGGTTLQNLIDRIADGRLAAEVVHVVSNRPGVRALERAGAAGIPATVVERKGRTLDRFGADIFGPIRGAGADLVILGGFLALLPIPADYAGRVMNVHPSLIPAFCGKGFHGSCVHAAALAHGVKLSGCTVHFADDTYDSGPIITQRVVPVFADDTPESLEARVFAAECSALPEAIALYAAGRIVVEGQRARVLPEAGDGHAGDP